MILDKVPTKSLNSYMNVSPTFGYSNHLVYVISFTMHQRTGGHLTENQLIKIVFFQLTKIFDAFQLIE
jgi:hypothetical protein